MSLYILDELLPSQQHHCHNHGLSSHPGDYWITPTECSLLRSPAGYLRSALSNLGEFEKQQKISKNDNQFQVCLDVQHYRPSEISVRTENNFIVVEANHEEREDSHGYISRRFTRRYQLPEGYKPNDVVSSVSSDGLLTIRCPKSEPAVEGNVRHIQIQQTGPARLNVKNDEKKAVKDQQKNGK